MHIAATAPLAVRREDISSDIISKEKEIFKDQALQSGKPENIIERNALIDALKNVENNTGD